MRFKLEFDCDSPGFERDPAGAFAVIALCVNAQLEAGYNSLPVRDENGNTIGSWELA